MAIVHIYLDDETINKLVNGEVIELNIRSRGDNRIFIKRERLSNKEEFDIEKEEIDENC